MHVTLRATHDNGITRRLLEGDLTEQFIQYQRTYAEMEHLYEKEFGSSWIKFKKELMENYDEHLQRAHGTHDKGEPLNPLMLVWRHYYIEEHELDGLFFPQSGVPNRPVVEDPERPDYNPNNWAEIPSNIINDIGVPTVTVPYSYFEDGTPFVLALIGDMWSEADLLAWAFALEQVTGSRTAPVLERGSGS